MGMLMTKQVNKNSKSLLAKCMATENIRVEHRADAETAYFDTANRLLCLPIWKDMSESIYDMLVAHEVSHALNTPAEGWSETLKTVPKSQQRLFHQFVNVVEDARIERLIKDQYPGIRRDFATAYQQLHDRDLFELAGKDISELTLLDRLNLEFKLGLFGHIQVSFSADEQQYVTRMANTETFDEVVTLSKELFELWDDAQPEPESGKSQQVEADSNEQGDSETGDETGDNGQSNDDDGESQDGSQSGSESEDGDENSDTSEGTDGVGDDAEAQSGDDSGQSQDDDTDDGESADSEDGDADGESGSDPSGLEYDDYSEGASPASTQRAFEQGISQMSDTTSRGNDYKSLPSKMNLENCIVDYTRVQSIWDKYFTELFKNDEDPENSYRRDYRDRVQKSYGDCQQFLNRSKSVVNHMVQQFQMRQAADADKRTDIAKTGILDTTTMINYRWSEDIFLKNEVHSDGKNHGMVFFLDWSGSMNSILQDTVEQLLILTEFCRKVSIPFEVYAFSSRAMQAYDNDGNHIDDLQYSVPAENASGHLVPHDFCLINFLSSKMNKVDYYGAVKNLHMAASDQHMVPREFGTGCTPLNEAVVCAFDIVPAFQEAHGVQIVSTVFLTDGDGHSMGAYRGYRSGGVVIHDPVTRRDYEVKTNRKETDVYLQILKDRTGCNTIGIRLHDSKSVQNLRYSLVNDDDMTEAAASYRKNNYCVASADNSAYDEYFIVKAHLNATEDIFEEIDDDVSYTKLRNAFKKSAGNSKSSRIIATKMIEIFAS